MSINKGFWNNLKKPIMVLAPMADVTDAAFRHVIAKYGKPDVMWTEFVSADGIVRATEEGKAKLMRDLLYSEAERPIVAQFFSAKPEMMRQAAMLATELGFDGIDINMGCPDKSIEKQGAGAAMIKSPTIAQDVIRAAKQGTEEAAKKIIEVNGKNKQPLPVSVKTRIGFNKNELETWLPALLEAEPALVTIHARTRKEMSKVPARWEHIRRAVEIRDEIQKELSVEERTLIFGNGDVVDLVDAEAKVKEVGCDGVMLGRAIFGNPWLFNREKNIQTISIREKLEVLVEHTHAFEKLLGDIKNFAIMKKHYKAYVNGWDGAKELRMKLMEATDADEVEKIILDFKF
jgi:nifR3 family TIM-barrel protein